MTLDEFRSKLERELERELPSPYSRPFVCAGSPLECRIFIVGVNPAREVEKLFWNFWSDSRGFKKAEFIRELKQLPGGLTKTRKNIERVADAAGQAVTLDTNIYLQPTPTAGELPKEHMKTDVIEYLLKTIRPKVVLAHGRKAGEFFRKRCRDFVDDGETPQKVTWDAWQWQFLLLCSPHLGFRKLTDQAAAKEAERIGQALAIALRGA
jgi:uracil-DNA glycosylase